MINKNKNSGKIKINDRIFKNLEVTASSFACALRHILLQKDMHTTVKCGGHSVKWVLERTHSISTWHQQSFFPSYGKLFLMWEIRCAYFILIENNKIQSIKIEK